MMMGNEGDKTKTYMAAKVATIAMMRLSKSI